MSLICLPSGTGLRRGVPVLVFVDGDNHQILPADPHFWSGVRFEDPNTPGVVGGHLKRCYREEGKE